MNQLILNLRQQAGIGSVVLGWNDEGRIDRVDWLGSPIAPPAQHPALVRSSSWATTARGELPGPVRRIAEQLDRYFQSGEPVEFDFWEHIDRSGWSEFQEKVYRATCDVPHGETRTYAWVARRIGRCGASRAVGQALRRNPVPLLVPCHRIVSTVALGGFMGASNPNDPELRAKKALLDLEQSYRNPVFSFLSASVGARELSTERSGMLPWSSLWAAQSQSFLGATV